jgi:hypothetical protein
MTGDVYEKPLFGAFLLGFVFFRPGFCAGRRICRRRRWVAQPVRGAAYGSAGAGGKQQHRTALAIPESE